MSLALRRARALGPSPSPVIAALGLAVGAVGVAVIVRSIGDTDDATMNPEHRRPPTVYTPRATVAQHARHALSGEPHVPAPTGLEFPHRPGSSKCDPQSRKWGYWYRLRAEDAREQAAVRLPEDASHEEYERAAGEDFAAKRGARRWIDREHECAVEFTRREERRKPKATESFARLRARHRQAALDRGEDVTGAEYLDSRIGRTVASR